jgi:nicotinate phosphoribosyltransferase
VFSNALSTNSAIELHETVNGSMKDSYGIGTHFTCDIDNVKPANMVIKLLRVRITEKREWHNCIKLSDDKGKYTGDPDTVKTYKHILDIE